MPLSAMPASSGLRQIGGYLRGSADQRLLRTVTRNPAGHRAERRLGAAEMRAGSRVYWGTERPVLTAPGTAVADAESRASRFLPSPGIPVTGPKSAPARQQLIELLRRGTDRDLHMYSHCLSCELAPGHTRKASGSDAGSLRCQPGLGQVLPRFSRALSRLSSYALRSASVGDSRAARSAGYMPATAPTTAAMPSPPQTATPGTSVAQPCSRATENVTAAPMPTPHPPPSTDSSNASSRNWLPMCPRVAPSARRSPISRRRSMTEITMTLAMPSPPARMATAPSPSSSVVPEFCTSRRAASASDGRLTWTCSGWLGQAVRASRAAVTAVWLVSVRT